MEPPQNRTDSKPWLSEMTHEKYGVCLTWLRLYSSLQGRMGITKAEMSSMVARAPLARFQVRSFSLPRADITRSWASDRYRYFPTPKNYHLFYKNILRPLGISNYGNYGQTGTKNEIATVKIHNFDFQDQTPVPVQVVTYEEIICLFFNLQANLDLHWAKIIMLDLDIN